MGGERSIHDIWAKISSANVGWSCKMPMSDFIEFCLHLQSLELLILRALQFSRLAVQGTRRWRNRSRKFSFHELPSVCISLEAPSPTVRTATFPSLSMSCRFSEKHEEMGTSFPGTIASLQMS